MSILVLAACSTTTTVHEGQKNDYKKIVAILDEPKGTSMNITYIPILSSYNISYTVLEKSGNLMSRDGQINCQQKKVIFFSGKKLSSEQEIQLVDYLCKTGVAHIQYKGP